VMDVSGEVQVDAHKDVWRTRLRSDGQRIGAAFEDLHSDTGEHRVDRKGEGCFISATLSVNKIAGNVHIALGSSHSHEGNGGGAGGSKHIHQFMMPEIATFDASHRIISFSFGPSFPYQINPLDSTSASIRPPATSAHFQYFIKIVPTIYTNSYNQTLLTNQYSVTSQTHLITPFDIARSDSRRVPGLFFVYDLSPFMVHITEKRSSFGHFLVSVCAIVGGVVTVAGILSSIIHNCSKIYYKR